MNKTALAILFGLAGTAQAADINVGPSCTLVNAIRSANVDRSIGSCTAGSGADDITLPKNSTLVLGRADNVAFGPTGLPVIGTEITIHGKGSRIIRAPSAPAFRILAVGQNGTLTLRDVTIAGGHADNPRTIGALGGGIYSEGRLIISRCNIINNLSDWVGGGVFSNSFSDENRVSGLSIQYSLIAGNLAFDGGGGVFVNGDAVDIVSSTVSNNDGGERGGGGISADALHVVDSTIVGNFAEFLGGGIFASVLGLDRSIVAGNYAQHDERGQGAEILVESFSRADNFNILGSASSPFFAVEPPNKQQSLEGIEPGATDITAMSDGDTPTNLEDMIELELKANGGLTLSHALLRDSIAIDTVNDGTCRAANDQRGVVKPQDGDRDGAPACDTGAYELIPVVDENPPSGKCAGLQATLVGNNGHDVIQGTSEKDIIATFNGNDLIYGVRGDDVICSGDGNDVVISGNGNNRVFGGPGNDRIFNENGNDTTFGGPGNDSINGGFGNDRLDGSIGVDSCNGGSGTDSAARCETVSNIP